MEAAVSATGSLISCLALAPRGDFVRGGGREVAAVGTDRRRVPRRMQPGLNSKLSPPSPAFHSSRRGHATDAGAHRASSAQGAIRHPGLPFVTPFALPPASLA